MERKITYIIEEDVAQAIRKVTGKINDIDFRGKFGLTEKEMELIHKYYDLVGFPEED